MIKLPKSSHLGVIVDSGPLSLQTHSSFAGNEHHSTGSTICELPSDTSLPANSLSPQELGKRNLAIGRAGEYLVMADLCLNNFEPMKTCEGSVYDIGLDINGKLVKIQIKATHAPRQDVVSRYRFSVTKKANHSTNDRKKYSSSEVDIIAFVALDIGQIAYMTLDSIAKWNVDFYSSAEILKNRRSHRSRLITEYPIHKALSQLESKVA